MKNKRKSAHPDTCSGIKAGAVIAAAAAAGLLIDQAAKKAAENKILHTDHAGKTVLITGATSGIGLELALLYARAGYNLILVSRNPNRPDSVCRQLQEKYPQQDIRYYPCDLSKNNQVQDLYKEIQRSGKVVDTLINCAGAGKAGALIDQDPQTIVDLINLNDTSTALMCRLFGADMARRKSGKILNVSSLSAFIPDPYLNVYAATKAFVYSLSRTLVGELESEGVQVSVLCPGPVKTSWSQNAGRTDSVFAISAKTCAREAFLQFEQGRFLIIPTRTYRLLGTAARFVPTRPAARLFGAVQRSLIRRKN